MPDEKQDLSKPTHLILYYENVSPEDKAQANEIMYRMVDDAGIKMGQVKLTDQRNEAMIVWGEDFRASKSRSFISLKHAKQYFRTVVAKEDLRDAGHPDYEPVIEVRNALGDSGLVIPSSIINVPNGRGDFN